jgi:metal-dependent amidase/aminoacylase/carboxypeptidase family protein
VAGKENVVEVEPIMGGEDFSHYTQQIPGFFLALGVRDPSANHVAHLHTPQFVLDEAALPVGVRLMASLAIDYLDNRGAK